jgi:hypothetical protein
MPKLIERFSTMGFGIAAIFFAFSKPSLSITLGILTLIVSVALEILAKKGIGLETSYSLDRRETVRLLGERAAASWVARFYRDTLVGPDRKRGGVNRKKKGRKMTKERRTGKGPG